MINLFTQKDLQDIELVLGFIKTNDKLQPSHLSKSA